MSLIMKVLIWLLSIWMNYTALSRSSQTEILADSKAMNLSYAVKLTKLISIIDSIKSQIVEIRSTNTTLHSDIAKLNNKI